MNVAGAAYNLDLLLLFALAFTVSGTFERSSRCKGTGINARRVYIHRKDEGPGSNPGAGADIMPV